MALTRELREMACRLEKTAVLAHSNAMLDLERSVCGCDYGSTGGATRLEAERIAQLLELRPGARLLDLGAGSGWPGLYLAQLTGCDVVLVDLPLAVLQIARERAMADGLAERSKAVAADGAALPFRDASFDALNHCEVLCCTPDKLGVLRACRRVARDGSTMAFTIIAPAPSLTDSERQIAIQCGPKFVDVEDDYAVLLGQSGWCLQERTDLTAALLQYMCAELDGMQSRADALAQVFGSDEFALRMNRQRATIAAIDSGFLRRELFVARASDETPRERSSVTCASTAASGKKNPARR
jgi:SAM-dependent methyltransferase